MNKNEERKCDMKIDKAKLDALLKLSDEELWCEIVRVGASKGFKLPECAPPHCELERLRATVKDGKINLGCALQIIDNYRKTGGR